MKILARQIQRRNAIKPEVTRVRDHRRDVQIFQGCSERGVGLVHVDGKNQNAFRRRASVWLRYRRKTEARRGQLRLNVRVQFDNQAGHPYGQKCRPPFIVPLPGHPDAMHDATRDARARKASY